MAHARNRLRPPARGTLRGRLLDPSALVLVAAAIAGAGSGLLPEPARAQSGGYCPANLEQGDPCTPSEKTDAGAAPSGSRPSTLLGNPISLVTGNKTQTETDYAVGNAPLAFRRHYASHGADANMGVGQGWRHTYAVFLTAAPDGARRIVDSTGRRVWFHPPDTAATEAPAPDAAEGATTETHRFTSRSSSDGFLIETDGRTTWHVPDGRRLSFRGSWLVRIDWPGERHLSLRYSRQRLTSITDETGRRIGLEWTPGSIGLKRFDEAAFSSHAGHLAAIVLPDGQRIGYDYDERQNLTRVRFANGTARRYHYENALWPSHLTGLTDRTGTREASWEYDDAGRAIVSEHAGGVERVALEIHAPEDEGRAVGDVGHTVVTAADGVRTVYRWGRHLATGAALIEAATGPGCATCPPTGLRYAYTDDGQLESVARLDADGVEIARRRFTRDPHGRLTSVVDTLFDGNGSALERLVERREYGSPGEDGSAKEGSTRGDSMEGSPSPATTLSWRPMRVLKPSVREGRERVLDIAYDADGLPLVMTERGFAPSHAFHGADDPESVDWKAIERVTRLGYDGGRLVRIDGPREDVEDVTLLDWDEHNRLVAVRPPAAPPLRVLAFDAHGRPAAIGIGRRTPFELRRDAEGNVVEVRRGKSVVRYAHDAEGRLVSVTDPFGRSMTLAHDAAGRLASVRDDLGRVTRLVHDLESRVVERTLTGIDGTVVKSLEQVLDAHGRIAGSRETLAGARDGESPSTHEVLVTENASARRTAITDSTSRSRVAVDIDLFDRSLVVERGEDERSIVRFDALGQDIAFTDARGNGTRFPRDDFGRVTLVDSPDTGRVAYRHDGAGNRIEARHEDGRVVRLTYDAAGRMTSREHDDDPSTATRWTWNEETGDLVEVANAASVERFAYDDDSRLIRHDRELGGRTFGTRYAYDEYGRPMMKRLPDGQSLRYHYHEDGPNRGTLRAITRPRLYALSQEVLVGEIDLETRDGEAGYRSHNGLRHRWLHGPDGVVRRIETGSGPRLDYTFDAAGRIVGIDEDGVRQTYRHDGRHLSTALTRTGRYVYLHDIVGNRRSRLHVSPQGVFDDREHRYTRAGDGNRLVATRDAATGRIDHLRHDRGGAIVASGDLGYTRDADGRTVAVHRAGTLVATYAYNAFGERVARTVHAANATPRTTWFLHDGDTLSAEIDEHGTVRTQYLYLEGYRPVAMLVGHDVRAIHGDHLGTPRTVTDDEGTVLWSADYTPFGRALVTRAAIAMPLRLPGQYADAETGLHHNRFRDYDPATGRYRSPDPLGLNGGANLYAYANADPLGTADPLGLFGVDFLSDRNRPSVAVKPRAKESDGLDLRAFGYFALWVGEQYVGYARGFLDAAGETVLFAADVLRYSADNSPIAVAVDLLYEDPPAWLPSYQRGQATSDRVVEIGEAILDDPSLIWQAISDPYVSAWAECRYGEAIGRGVFEIGTALLPAGLAARLATLSRASRLSTFADTLTVLRRGEAAAPEEYAQTLSRLVEEARASGTMDELVAAARATDTLDALVSRGALKPDELGNTLALIEYPELGTLTELLENANRPVRPGGVSAIARAIDKHSNRKPTAYASLTGNAITKNSAASEIARQIIDDPNATLSITDSPRLGRVLDVISTDGRGMRFNLDGEFIGLLEPPR